LMLQCIYTIGFLCLLCFDEVLKIQAHHLEVIDEGRGEIKLTLPFRKTHKHGGIWIMFKLVLTTSHKSSHFIYFITSKTAIWTRRMLYCVGFISLTSEKDTYFAVSMQMKESLLKTNR